MGAEVTDYVKRSPSVGTVDEIADYLEWHRQNGRGKLQIAIRDHMLAIPPEGMTHDDEEGFVFLTGIYPAV